MTIPDDIGIGSTIWRHGAFGRDEWVPRTITGETSRSWIVGNGYGNDKAPKKGPHPGWAYSEREIQNSDLITKHSWRIADAVRLVGDADKLRRVAELVGYEIRYDYKVKP